MPFKRVCDSEYVTDKLNPGLTMWFKASSLKRLLVMLLSHSL